MQKNKFEINWKITRYPGQPDEKCIARILKYGIKIKSSDTQQIKIRTRII